MDHQKKAFCASREKAWQGQVRTVGGDARVEKWDPASLQFHGIQVPRERWGFPSSFLVT